MAVTLAELADRFLQEHVASHCKPRTQEEYKRAVERGIKRRWGGTGSPTSAALTLHSSITGIAITPTKPTGHWRCFPR